MTIGATAWLDLAALLLVLLGLNLLAPLRDLGWLRLQPCPYLLLPLCLGLRHGVGCGVAAGVVGFMIPGGAHLLLHGWEWSRLISEHWLLLTASLITGWLCGETRWTLEERASEPPLNATEREERSLPAGREEG